MFNPVRYTRRGGMRFLRIGRLQLSWCVCRRPLVRPLPRGYTTDAGVLVLPVSAIVEG